MMRLVGLFMMVAFVVGLSPCYGADDYEYVGAKKCKICHSTDKKAGTHYKVWEEEPHAKAFETLLTDKAKEAAKKHGIDDPSKAEACLSCHTVVGSPNPEEGVSCEACHGPASGYVKIHEKEGYDAAVAAGMTDYFNMDKEAKAATCTKCHKEDPMNDFYKPFDYDEYYKKIDHSGATSPEVKAKREKEGK
ncbi:MAG: hypothetical protein KC940_11995 [Candidatus Omnitrophica bacterium]|nr:hypothetical protein [Candidatus Omnitrophota bacterium]